MFLRIAGFELRYQLKNPVLWVAAGLFFLFTFGLVASEQVQIGGAGGNTHENGPFSIAQAMLTFSVFYMFVTTAFVANVVVRDDDTGFGPIVRATRVTKFDYLFGRFAGAFLVAAIGFLAVPLGIWLGSLMPWLDPETLGPNRASYYAWPLLALALPNILITSAVFFALATATRSMMTTYVGVVAFLIIWLIVNSSLAQNPEYRAIGAFTEPFGIAAYAQVARYWTAAERNALVPDFAGFILWNRLVWTGIALLFLAVAYWTFRFAEKGLSRRQQRKARKEAAIERALAAEPPPLAGTLPPPAENGASARARFLARTRFEMRQVFRSPAFPVLLALGLFNSVTALWFGSVMYGTPTYPATFTLIPILEGTFSIIPVIIAIYYGGELVWRERDRKTHEIIDATPIPNWAFALPKALAVALVLVATVLVSVAAGMLVQMLKGYTDFELGKYFLWYILPSGYDMMLLAILSIFVQSLSPNKYVGWGIMVLWLVAGMIFSGLGLEHNLYLYGETPDEPLSDMNGAGIYWKGAWWFRLYWGAIAIVLLVLAHLLWRRGTETRLKPRLRRMPARLRGTPGLIAGGAIMVAALTGGWIFYNTNVLNPYLTSDHGERMAAEYERRYLRYENLPQPSIAHAVFDVDLYPADIRAEVRGRYLLRNLTGQPIRDVHVRRPDINLQILAIDFPGARLASNDEEYGYRIYRLDRPMAPGETRQIGFRTRRQQVGFRNSGNDTRLVPNGTFLNNMEIAPAIGMDRFMLLSDRTTRRKYDLPPELRPARLEDMSATRRSYFGGGWSTADITLSTAADQVPIAPGRKVSDRTANGRRTARFISDAPILTFFSIQSARYAEAQRVHDGVTLSVFHHPDHGWNADRMLNALQHSLDYCQASFGPYQFDQARIIEFPGYATFAQAFANTMPYSEAIGFVTDNRDPEEIDYVTYVTAHELAHQWWAHQLIGADMQGGTMLSETLAQYSALMVMKRLYGEDKIRRFLKFELDNYLRSRGQEGVEELPLARVENQGYIHYRKGSVVMYLLQERLGEEAVNRALRRLLERYRFRGAPYPRSVDLIRLLREEARTPEQQALITDLFERITVYDLKVDQPTATRRADGRWDVTVTVDARKYYADGEGVETETRVAEPVEIGLFTALPGHGAFDRSNVLLMERRPLRSGRQVLRFVTATRPSHAGVDPYNFYVDRNSDDNVAPVG
ncbi:ABC transporter permease/M1 family aminopeptidase [Sphingosinicella terrae]|uniref:ABC transporter permease/M1 family aminopeptidase n=1 Tax=Sphingosinicella terrae TaxID=2172047 RepID=UPI000E0CCAD1|nr:M1 family aminopeptidase [Sphingosinicella terrae]